MLIVSSQKENLISIPFELLFELKLNGMKVRQRLANFGAFATINILKLPTNLSLNIKNFKRITKAAFAIWFWQLAPEYENEFLLPPVELALIDAGADIRFAHVAAPIRGVGGINFIFERI